MQVKTLPRSPKPMKTIEELHAEAAVNLRAIHATYFHKDCFLACVIALLAATVISFLI